MAGIFGELSAKDKIVQAKIRLRKRNPFFSGLAQYLEPQESNEVQHMGVDGENDILYYNPEWAESINSEVILEEMIHNILHKSLGHTNEQYENSPIGDLAKDIKVDNIMTNEGFGSRRNGTLADNAINYEIFDNTANITIKDKDNKSHSFIYDNIDKGFVEQLYGKMSHMSVLQSPNDKKPNNSDGDGDNEPKGDHGKHSKSQTASKNKQTKKWAKRMQQSAMQSKGIQSSELQRMLDKLSEPEVDWNDLFRDRVSGMMITDFTWAKPSKLFYSMGIYLPGYIRQEFKLLIGIDTSGSVSQKQFSKMMGEVYSIFEQHPSVVIDVLVGDTRLTDHIHLTASNKEDILTTPITGGGGTSHTFYKKWIEENDWNGDVLVLMTDGYSNIQSLYPKWNRDFETIFIYDKSINPTMAEYGDIIYMDKL